MDKANAKVEYGTAECGSWNLIAAETPFYWKDLVWIRAISIIIASIIIASIIVSQVAALYGKQ